MKRVACQPYGFNFSPNDWDLRIKLIQFLDDFNKKPYLIYST